MKNKEIIKQLDILNNLIKNKHYEEAQEHIRKTKIQLMIEENKADNYIDELVNELK